MVLATAKAPQRMEKMVTALPMGYERGQQSCRGLAVELLKVILILPRPGSTWLGFADSRAQRLGVTSESLQRSLQAFAGHLSVLSWPWRSFCHSLRSRMFLASTNQL